MSFCKFFDLSSLKDLIVFLKIDSINFVFCEIVLMMLLIIWFVYF